MRGGPNVETVKENNNGGGQHAAAWSSRFGFLMASIGFAVGLGNIWRFPYVTGENGGGAFVIVYLLCAFGIGVPILMSELMLGRWGQLTPPSSMASVARKQSLSVSAVRIWTSVGYLNLLTAFSILIAYAVVAGWVLSYWFDASRLLIGFAPDALAMAAHSSLSTQFDSLLANVPRLVLFSVVTMCVAGAIIFAGVQKGIERAVVVLMPLLFALMIGLAIFNAFNGGMVQTLDYLFSADFSKLSGGMLLAALGQAFFSIGVAMAGMMMFGAYLPKSNNIGQSAVIIVAADTLVAILAGLVIFPMVFSQGLDPSGGTGLIFQTLPLAFADMPGGVVIGFVFFSLLSVAAITSVVGLCEPVAAWIGERFSRTRQFSAVVLVAVTLAFSLVSVLSYNLWAQVGLGGMSLATLLDFVPNQIFLPVGGLMIALFVGWIVRTSDLQAQLGLRDNIFHLWHKVLRFIVVPAVFIVFISGVVS